MKHKQRLDINAHYYDLWRNGLSKAEIGRLFNLGRNRISQCIFWHKCHIRINHERIDNSLLENQREINSGAINTTLNKDYFLSILQVIAK